MHKIDWRMFLWLIWANSCILCDWYEQYKGKFNSWQESYTRIHVWMSFYPVSLIYGYLPATLNMWIWLICLIKTSWNICKTEYMIFSWVSIKNDWYVFHSNSFCGCGESSFLKCMGEVVVCNIITCKNVLFMKCYYRLYSNDECASMPKILQK